MRTSSGPGFRFSPVAPIQVLEVMFHSGPNQFGNYHLLLAHHTVEEPERFAVLFNAAANWWNARGYNFTVIMDNSLVECGGAVSKDMVMDAADLIRKSLPYGNSNEVVAVLPDAMGDGITTRELVRCSIDSWTETARELGLSLMGVTQGYDAADFRRSLETLSADHRIKWLGVPRVLHKTMGSRVWAARDAVETGKQIHLLGFSDDMHDDFAASRVPGIRGIDSAVPIRLNAPYALDAIVAPRDPKWFKEGQLSSQNRENLIAARTIFENRLSNASAMKIV